MSQPANPPPYDAIFTQGPPEQPIQTQPQPQVTVQIPQRQPMDIVPATVICSNCNHMVCTRLEVRPAFRTHAFAIGLFLVGMWPCCFIPYCVPYCNNVEHYCPHCNSYIGAYKG